MIFFKYPILAYAANITFSVVANSCDANGCAVILAITLHFQFSWHFLIIRKCTFAWVKLSTPLLPRVVPEVFPCSILKGLNHILRRIFPICLKKPHYIIKMKCQARDKSLLSCCRNNFYSKSGCLIESEFGLETPSNSPMFKVGDPKQFEICHLNLSSGL